MFRNWLRVGMLCLAPLATGLAAQSTGADELAALLERAGASVERYFSQAQSLMCLEAVTLQTLGPDLSPDRSPQRRLQYDLRIAWDDSTPGEAQVQRQLVKVGSRPPGPRDKPGCMDPRDSAPEPLSILLPANRKDYSFSPGGRGRVNGRNAVVVNYRSLEQGPITAKQTGENCWSAELPGRERGKLWIDAETSDVLRHDSWLSGIYDIELPPSKEKPEREILTISRYDNSTVYRRVTFKDPDETIVLPQSIELLQVVRNAGNVRIRHTFSNYRRFLSSGRIVQD